MDQLNADQSTAVHVDDLADVLQNVVCPPGLVVAGLVRVLPELEPFTRLDRVQGSIGDRRDDVAVAAAVVDVVTDTLEHWNPCPSRTACERLLGIGSTRGMPRRDRRRSAREVLGVGEEHFRKKRERDLLRELAAEILVAGTAERGADTPRQPAGVGLASATRRSSGSWARRRQLWIGVAVGAALLGAGTATLVVLHRPSPPPAALTTARSASHQSPPGPLVAGDDDRLVGETYPDGTPLRVGQHFVKTWDLQNTGTVVWHGRSLVRQGASPADGCPSPARAPIPETPAGQVAAVSVPITARGTPGTCRSTWKMVDADGRQSFPGKTGVYLLLPVTP